MTSNSRPYAKLSADLPLHQLLNGQSAYPAAVFLWFVTALSQQPAPDNRVRVSESYGEIMLATGIARQRTIVTTLQHLDDAGLVTYCGLGADGYRHYEVCRTYVIAGPGAPEGDGGAERIASRTESCSSYTLTKDRLSEEVTTTTKTHPARSESPDARLLSLGVAVSEDTWYDLCEQYGVEAVVKYGRWYAHAHRTGYANGTGWLYSALKQGWTSAPLGYNERDWLTGDERRARLEAEARKYGAENV